VASITPPIIFSLWEVRNSSNVLLASLESPGKADFVYAFPYLDTFTIRLTVLDSGLHNDTIVKTYVVDECPICTGGGGGAPSGPAMAEKYKDSPGKISVTGMKTKDLEYCPVVKAKIISKEDL